MMSEDIVDRLTASVKAARATDRSELLKEAADEIRSLRVSVTSTLTAAGEWARRAGYHEGSLLSIMHGCPDPAGAARKSLEHFGAA